ncbi:MAG: hypothetical protein JXR36_00505 [Bacteroidales bacterium]|nr:hypothetical protein [Bacteroidales bacterium]
MLRITYDALKDDSLKSILTNVVSVCKDLQIEYFILGATARNIWFASGNEKPETTKDVDFALYVVNSDDYINLKDKLISEYNFVKSTANEYCLITAEGRQVVLLPFSETKKQNLKILDAVGIATMNFDGFMEAYKFGMQQTIIDSEIYNVCSIPAIVILKLIAFDDRSEHRIKDVDDINSICNHYHSIEDNYIWDEYSELYLDNLSHQDVALKALGKEMKKILNSSLELQQRILDIMDKALTGQSSLLRYMIEDSELETIEMKANMIKLVKQGFEN